MVFYVYTNTSILYENTKINRNSVLNDGFISELHKYTVNLTSITFLNDQQEKERSTDN